MMKSMVAPSVPGMGTRVKFCVSITMLLLPKPPAHTSWFHKAFHSSTYLSQKPVVGATATAASAAAL